MTYLAGILTTFIGVQMLMYSRSSVFTKSNWSCSDCNGDESVASRRVLIRSMAVVSSFL